MRPGTINLYEQHQRTLTDNENIDSVSVCHTGSLGHGTHTHLTTDYASPEDCKPTVNLSRRVQDTLTASGSLQQVGPLDSKTFALAIEEHHCFVLRATRPPAETKIIGCAFIKLMGQDYYAPNTMPSEDVPSPWLYLHWFMLDPQSQGQGLGLAFIADITKMVRKDLRYSKGTLFLDCWAGNDKLRHFYARAGFTFVSVLPKRDFEVAIFDLPLKIKGDGSTATTNEEAIL